VLHYGLDVHKKYTTFCVMDEHGNILREGKCPTGFHTRLSERERR
jgi:hypothetical protein